MVELTFNKRQKKDIAKLIIKIADDYFDKDYQYRQWLDCQEIVLEGMKELKKYMNTEIKKKSGIKMLIKK